MLNFLLHRFSQLKPRALQHPTKDLRKKTIGMINLARIFCKHNGYWKPGIGKVLIVQLFIMLTSCVQIPVINLQTPTTHLDAVTIVHVQGRKQFCSGVLITQKTILTARHCVQKMGEIGPLAASLIRVGFGIKTSDVNIRWNNVESIVIPKSSNYDQVENLQGSDFAILTLQSMVSETPIVLHLDDLTITPNSEFRFIGFGEDEKGFIGIKHSENIIVVAKQKDTFTFTGGGCRGDSGGPIINSDNELIGLISLGSSIHCTPRHIRVAQLLHPFNDLIKSYLTNYYKTF